MKTWIFQGYAGHFIGAPDCLFHLSTTIGKYIVSTVGNYRPYRNARGINEIGKIQEIGHKRFYETMVFLKKKCNCGCGFWVAKDGKTLDFEGYNTPQEAQKGHYKYCKKWSI